MANLSLLSRLETYEERYDTRRQASVYYRMSHYLFVLLLGITCGISQMEELFHFATEMEDWFRPHLGEGFDVPKRTSFYTMLRAVDVPSLRSLFIGWVKDNHEVLSGIIALDGKTARGTADDTQKAAHIVSAFSADLRIVLGQTSCKEKSNEIKAIPELLEKLAISGCIVTVDAMGTQEDIAQTIVKQGADYVFIAKGNQESTSEAVEFGVYDFMHSDKVKPANIAFTDEEKGHGRYESKAAVVCNDPGYLPEEIRAKWPKLAGFGAVFCTTRKSKAEPPVEVPTYFFYSVPDMTAEQLLKIKSAHWTIECDLHWSLDVQFREDACRTRKDRAGEVLNLLRHSAVNLLKETPELDKYKSKATKQLMCLMSAKLRNAVAKTAGSYGVLDAV